MQIHSDIPESIARDLAPDPTSLSRVALESIALEGYRSGRFSDEQVRRLLGFESRFDVHAFLKEHGVCLNYSMEDLRQDLESSDRWLSSPAHHR